MLESAQSAKMLIVKGYSMPKVLSSVVCDWEPLIGCLFLRDLEKPLRRAIGRKRQLSGFRGIRVLQNRCRSSEYHRNTPLEGTDRYCMNFFTPCIWTCPDDLVTAFATAPRRNAKQAQPTVKPPTDLQEEIGKKCCAYLML